MPASRPRCEPPQRRLQGDDRAVSEVVGQMLMFGILSMVLILTLVAFNVAKESAEERILDTTAASVAQRVASLVVDTALFAETFQDDSVDISSRLELPLLLESRHYMIDMGSNAVTITSDGTSARAPLFSSGSPGIVHICDQTPIDGGSVRIFASPSMPADCPGAPLEDTDLDPDGDPIGPPFYIYLESAHAR